MEELLETPIVKASILRYLENGLTTDEIRLKLMDIHLIIVTNDELEEIIKKLKNEV